VQPGALAPSLQLRYRLYSLRSAECFRVALTKQHRLCWEVDECKAPPMTRACSSATRARSSDRSFCSTLQEGL